MRDGHPSPSGGLSEEGERVLHLSPDAVSDVGTGGCMVPPNVLLAVADGAAIFHDLLPVRHSCPPSSGFEQ
jgi:hypothetical protein